MEEDALDSFLENVNKSEVEAEKKRTLLRDLENKTEAAIEEIAECKAKVEELDKCIQEKENEIIQKNVELDGLMRRKGILTDLHSSAKKKVEEEKKNLENIEDNILLRREKFCSFVREHVKKYGLMAALRKYAPVEEEEDIIIEDDEEITQMEQEIANLQSEIEQVERDLISSDDRQKDLTEENKQLLDEPTGGKEFIRLQDKMKQQHDKSEHLESKCRDLERTIITMGSGSATSGNNETFMYGGVNWHNSTTGNTTSKKRVSFYCYEENVSNVTHQDSGDVPTDVKYENMSDYPSRGQEPQRDLKKLYPVNEPENIAPNKGNVNYYADMNSKQEQQIYPVNLQQREQQNVSTSVRKEGQHSNVPYNNYNEQQPYGSNRWQGKSPSNSQAAYWQKGPQLSVTGQKKGFNQTSSLEKEQSPPVEILTEDEQDSPIRTWDGERQVGQTLQFASPSKFIPKKPSSISSKFRSRHQ